MKKKSNFEPKMCVDGLLGRRPVPDAHFLPRDQHRLLSSGSFASVKPEISTVRCSP
jgi:hypothetical protein